LTRRTSWTPNTKTISTNSGGICNVPEASEYRPSGIRRRPSSPSRCSPPRRPPERPPKRPDKSLLLPSQNRLEMGPFLRKSRRKNSQKVSATTTTTPNQQLQERRLRRPVNRRKRLPRRNPLEPPPKRHLGEPLSRPLRMLLTNRQHPRRIKFRPTFSILPLPLRRRLLGGKHEMPPPPPFINLPRIRDLGEVETPPTNHVGQVEMLPVSLQGHQSKVPEAEESKQVIPSSDPPNRFPASQSFAPGRSS